MTHVPGYNYAVKKKENNSQQTYTGMATVNKNQLKRT